MKVIPLQPQGGRPPTSAKEPAAKILSTSDKLANRRAKVEAARRAEGQRLREAMHAHGCSLEMLGEHADVTRQGVHRWLMGLGSIPTDRLIAAAHSNERCRKVVEAYLSGAIEDVRRAA